ncbi:restriction endonuclease [Pectobacterium brasiliense]|uniref:restriction endonuclease n=1 Tax=Pectobacterium brasiliense TaxID=180957 RepID=UPI002405D7C4|nr:restriction endonuclease [Pectobacterium brasiliense]MDG0804316.1 restriction endonuclease [Pectobacterium brasiliense]
MIQRTEAKPPLYRGFPLPLHELSSNSFEDFVYQALLVLSESKGFEMQSGRQPSGDQGFDCTAKINGKHELVCIQCKRYSTALYINTVAEEIIKVALESTLNNSSVKQHYIITSGVVSKFLRQALRQDNYLNLKNECNKIIKKGKFQTALLKEIEVKCIDPIDVINKYIDSLEKIVVWSGVDFQNELLVIWSDLENILENNFLVEKVLKDQPTPDFDVRGYLNKKINEVIRFAPLYYNLSSLPVNLKSENELEVYKEGFFSVDDIIFILKSEKNLIISSSGGSGKSFTLSVIERVLASNENDIEYIPVRIKLRSYSRNTLNDMIERELGISYGSWKSLPFKFIFLFDGLDEMLQHDTQSFYDDLSSTLGGNNYILTVRNTGLSVETTSDLINACFSIQPLSYRSVFKIASEIFEDDDLQVFCKEYRSKINITKYSFISSPFVLSFSIDYYKKHKTLPKSIEELLDDWILRKINGDKSRVTDISLKVNRLPTSKIEEAFSLILYKANFEYNISSISEDVFIELIVECYDELYSSNSYLSKVLTLDEFISVVHQYEILYKGDDGFFSTPHAIISDYLSSKILAKKWRKYKGGSFNQSHYDIWLYCSDFLDYEDKEDYLNTVFDFDICLGAKVANKFKGDFVEDIQNRILELEKSEKILTRSNAIFALGILGTEKCNNRLKSLEGCVDYHHTYQRRRVLALSGDQETLNEILVENEDRAQAPIKISGGNYSLWFTSPPTAITEIARGRIEEWLGNRRPPLCMSLRTLALFGDSFDVKNLISVLRNTSYRQEFDDAAIALLDIDRDALIEELNNITRCKKKESHWAKNILLSIGIECNVNDEFDFFIEQSKKEESWLINNSVVLFLDRLVDFLSKVNLDDEKIDILIDTYKNLKFSSDFYYRGLIWKLARNGRSGCFLPIVENAYLRKDPSEINNAINYLCYLDVLDIDDSLSKEIDAYFESLNGKYAGIFYYYIQYYYKHKSKDFSLGLMKKEITERLSLLSPDNVSRMNYLLTIVDYSTVFELLSHGIVNEINIEEDDALKFLLISTDFLGDKERKIKLKILSDVNKEKIDFYCSRIKDSDVKSYVVSYLLFNELSGNPRFLIEEYLLRFMSHHFFHPTVEYVCVKYWDDNLARFFLTCFVELDWEWVNAQQFEKYTILFSNLLSREQLESFEKIRVTPVNILVERIYQIWLESKKLV